MSERECAIFQRWLSYNLFLYRCSKKLYIISFIHLYATGSDDAKSRCNILWIIILEEQRSPGVTIDTVYKSIPYGKIARKYRRYSRQSKMERGASIVFNCVRSSSCFASMAVRNPMNRFRRRDKISRNKLSCQIQFDVNKVEIAFFIDQRLKKKNKLIKFWKIQIGIWNRKIALIDTLY